MQVKQEYSSAHKGTFLRQTVPSYNISCFHTFATISLNNTADGAIKIFSSDAHERRLIRAYDICSAIRYLFADDVTIMLAGIDVVDL